jgi:hypothetical protein
MIILTAAREAARVHQTPSVILQKFIHFGGTEL